MGFERDQNAPVNDSTGSACKVAIILRTAKRITEKSHSIYELLVISKGKGRVYFEWDLLSTLHVQLMKAKETSKLLQNCLLYCLLVSYSNTKMYISKRMVISFSSNVLSYSYDSKYFHP